MPSVAGIVKAAGQRYARMRDACNVAVAEQRQNWMIERRGGNLDLAARGEILVDRNHLAQDLLLLARHDGLIIERVIALLRQKRFHFVVVRLKLLIEPGELRQDLQIAKILRAEDAAGPLWIGAGFQPGIVKLTIAAIAVDQAAGIGLEEILQNEFLL